MTLTKIWLPYSGSKISYSSFIVAESTSGLIDTSLTHDDKLFSYSYITYEASRTRDSYIVFDFNTPKFFSLVRKYGDDVYAAPGTHLLYK